MRNKGPRRRKPLNSLLIKPAGPDCNLACSYCFYSSRASLFPGTPVHRMSDDVLEETLRQALSGSQGTVSVGWQGGEPTLMGLDFFKRAIEIEARYGQGKAVANALQTNGLLLDREWARFLRNYDFLVGLSIDGPEHVHDRYRRNAAGRGTWADVKDKAKLLLDEGVSVNAISVINDHSVKFPREIYEFHRSIGLDHMQFIPCVETARDDPGRAAAFSVPAEDLGDFLIAVFDLWSAAIGTPDQLYVRFFESLFFGYVGMRPPECLFLPECGDYVVVEHNGDIYSCDFFVEDRWKLGNVMTGRLEHMLNSGRQKEFGERKSALPGPCRACRWLERCRGGCPKDRLRDPRDAGLDHFCPAYKAFFEHADARFKELAERWKKG